MPRKIIAIERFWRQRGKIGMGEKFFQNLVVYLASQGCRTIRVKSQSEPLLHQIINQRIARSSIESQRQTARRDKSQIGDPANIDDSHRTASRSRALSSSE